MNCACAVSFSRRRSRSSGMTPAASLTAPAREASSAVASRSFCSMKSRRSSTKGANSVCRWDVMWAPVRLRCRRCSGPRFHVGLIGRVIDAPKTAQLYGPLQEKEPYQGVKTERDVKYGDVDRNLLDVFMPEAPSSPRPVLIYVHGGGFVRGDKRAPGSPFNDNIMLWAVRNGYIGVDVTYRLAPQAVWPAGAEG